TVSSEPSVLLVVAMPRSREAVGSNCGARLPMKCCVLPPSAEKKPATFGPTFRSLRVSGSPGCVPLLFGSVPAAAEGRTLLGATMDQAFSFFAAPGGGRLPPSILHLG